MSAMLVQSSDEGVAGLEELQGEGNEEKNGARELTLKNHN
jgi:hypothetical protein